MKGRRLIDMGALPDRDELQHLIDQMNPGQVRRLLRLVQSSPDLGGDETAARPVPRRIPQMAEPGPRGDALRRFRLFAGSIDSGRGDLSERHDEIIREGLPHRDGLNSRPA